MDEEYTYQRRNNALQTAYSLLMQNKHFVLSRGSAEDVNITTEELIATAKEIETYLNTGK